MRRTFRSRQAGFTLIEVLVAFSLATMVSLVILTSFLTSTRLSRVQIDIADLQQTMRVSLRDVTRYARSTGRGGLARAQAFVLQQNVASGTTIGTQAVAPETDVLSVRGAFSSPIYRIDAQDPLSFQISVDGQTAQLLIDSVTKSGFEQPLGGLKDLVLDDNGVAQPEPILLVSQQTDTLYAVVELANASFANVTLPIQNQSVTVERATLSLSISGGAGTHTAEYLAMSTGGVFQPTLTNVLFASVLEEYRYYIRDDATGRAKLSRARMVPGTDTVHPGPLSNAIDIADNILDLQVALGIDLDGDGEVDSEDAAGNPLAADVDEWQFNDPGDDLGLGWDAAPLFYLQVSFLGETARRDRRYISRPIDSIENRVYNETPPTTPAEIAARRYRRRLLQGLVDMRNL